VPSTGKDGSVRDRRAERLSHLAEMSFHQVDMMFEGLGFRDVVTHQVDDMLEWLDVGTALLKDSAVVG
jgi:hypothetical protein